MNDITQNTKISNLIDSEMLRSALMDICTKYNIAYGKASTGLGLDLSLLPDTLSVPVNMTIAHGHWIPIYACEGDRLSGRAMEYECSVCGKIVPAETYVRRLDYEFCPYCKAAMDDDQNCEDCEVT